MGVNLPLTFVGD